MQNDVIITCRQVGPGGKLPVSDRRTGVILIPVSAHRHTCNMGHGKSVYQESAHTDLWVSSTIDTVGLQYNAQCYNACSRITPQAWTPLHGRVHYN